MRSLLNLHSVKISIKDEGLVHLPQQFRILKLSHPTFESHSGVSASGECYLHTHRHTHTHHPLHFPLTTMKSACLTGFYDLNMAYIGFYLCPGLATCFRV